MITTGSSPALYWDVQKDHDELFAAVQKTAELVGWSVDKDHHSGAWEWHEDPCCDMGHAGYATPEWDGLGGTVVLDRFTDESTPPDTELHTLELTGNPEMDALRIVLKIINAFVRGY